MTEVRPVTLQELRAALDVAPAMCDVADRLSLLFLSKSVRIVEAPGDLVADMDSLEPQPSVPILCPRIDRTHAMRLPAFRLDHDPLGTGLNEVLPGRFEEFASLMLRQSHVAAHIAARVAAVQPDCVVWLIVDGLAYGDVVRHAPTWIPRTRPVLVDGISTTGRGMPRLVGIPRLAHRLFSLGYDHLHGFTYWTREANDLTDMLFDGFGPNVKAARSMASIITDLRALPLDRAFVQVIRDGTDHVAHDWRGVPPVGALVQGCLDQLQQLADVVRAAGCSALLFLCTDHGMLWRDEHHLVEVPEPGQPPPRYHAEPRIGDRLFTFPGVEGTGSALRYPYVRRTLRANEWGVHGGLSYEESVIPLVELAV